MSASSDTNESASVERSPVSHRAVLAIAIPIVFSNVTTPLLGLVDTAVIGRLGEAKYLGGVALGALIFSTVYWAFGFLRMGTTGLTAQAKGANDGSEIRAALGRSLLIAGGIGLLILLLQIPIKWLAFKLLPGEPDVERLARGYYAIRIWSAPAALANYAVLGWFIGLGRAGKALTVQIFLNGVNAALDVFFVWGLGWGVRGVAAGTLIAEISAAVFGIAFALVHLRRIPGVWQLPRLLDREGIARTLSVNRDIFIRTLALLAAFAWFTAEGARQGDLVLAVNAILQQFVAVSAFFLDGFAFSAEALVGRSIGARHRAEVVLAVRRSTLWAGTIALALTVLLAVFGPYAIDGLSTDPAVRALGRHYYLWAAAIPFLAVWCYQLDGIFIGATRGATMRNAMLIAFVVYLLLWWALRPFGNHGLWAAFAGFMVARAVTLGWFYPALLRTLPERADDPALAGSGAE